MKIRTIEYVLVACALTMLLVACIFGGAKVEADVPIYGNAAITVEPGTLELPISEKGAE